MSNPARIFVQRIDVPGAPAQLVFTVAPSSTPALSTISPPVVVTVADAKGNTVTGYSGGVTIGIGANPLPLPSGRCPARLLSPS